jgi:excisionase family DNA binding protein
MSDSDRLTLTVSEVAARLGLSRNGAYEAVAVGQIPSIRIGRRVLIPKAALNRMLNTTGELEPSGAASDVRASAARK